MTRLCWKFLRAIFKPTQRRCMHVMILACRVLKSTRVFMDTLIEIDCGQVVPTIPENVVNVSALLGGHNIVLVALRGGLLELPC
mmetsp:Transcript_11714/g.20122  ORF Transcript_11714/g.20122 Transcript_11714/m.20122 type:complete len:84 (+) Transcript_11714:1726-1977(+)